MRLGAITSKLRKPLLTVMALAIVSLAIGGCKNSDIGPEDAFGKSFFNPAEMAPRLGRQTLQLPILSSLSGLDEPNEEFAAARNVTAADLQADSTDYVIGKNDLLQVSLSTVEKDFRFARAWLHDVLREDNDRVP